MRTSALCVRLRTVAVSTFICCGWVVALTSTGWSATVLPFGQTLDLGGAPGNNADVSSFSSEGSLFFNIDSNEPGGTGQESQVSDGAEPIFGDDELRNDVPSYITIEAGSGYAGVSGGWGYQQILVGDGNTPDPFESGVGSVSNDDGQIATFTAGAGVLSDLRVGVLVDILDGVAFNPADITVSVGAA